MKIVAVRPGPAARIRSVAPECGPWLEEAAVVAVEVDLDNRAWHLRLQAPEQPTPEQLEILCRCLRRLPGGPAHVHIQTEPFSIPKEPCSEWLPRLLEEVRQAAPAAAGLLSAGSLVVEGTVVIAQVPNEVACQALQRPAARAAITSAMARHAGPGMEFRVEPCAQLQEAMDREEIARPAALPRAAGPERARPPALRQVPITPLKELQAGPGTVHIQGEVFLIDRRLLKNGGIISVLGVTDRHDSVYVKHRCKDASCCQFQRGSWVRASGTVQVDEYEGELTLSAKQVVPVPAQHRLDESEPKRVELHLHTKLSAMDAVCDLEEVFATLERWGHQAVAITDHGVVQAFPEAYDLGCRHGVKVIFGIEAYLIDEDREDARSYHVVLLVQNAVGMQNLYRLVSCSHLDYFYRVPRMPRALLQAHRQGLLVGSACQAGEVFQAMLDRATPSELRAIGGFYDFLEVQPLENNYFLVESGRVESLEELAGMNCRLVELGDELGKPVVATGDVHFIEPEDEVYRRVLMAGQGYTDAEHQAPLYLHSTQEMLDRMAHLGPERARRVVVDTPRWLADQVEVLRPVPEGLFPPVIPGSEAEVREQAFQRAIQKFGSILPHAVQSRLERELDAIIGNGFAGIYVIAARLVARSRRDGYLVGSRGSVGSSLVATMCQITEVDPLPPYYVCPQCHYSRFITDGSVASGFDLPRANCPGCGSALDRDGQEIAFETFMGFRGEKVPDIDLNFSGAYQAEIHRYAEELLGKDQVFRAGTIATLADKTAYGFVKGYQAETGTSWRKSEVDRLALGLTGVKRTTGQHPGGLMIVPGGRLMSEFSPVQYPADDRRSGTVTTHFDYEAVHSQLVKLDLLGHDDPTSLRMLQDLTGIDPLSIPFDDEATLAIFSGLGPLGLDEKGWELPVGSAGIPEFGTRFVRKILLDTRPRSFSELVRVSGLSHGTGVWLGNADELIRRKVADIGQVITSRDDIMLYLIHRGMAPVDAFRISESVRKGKGVPAGDAEAMLARGVPEWFVDSCRKIKYLFPKAHAVAYVMMAFRIAYFKVHHPVAFYATYFSTRAAGLDATLLMAPGEYRGRFQQLAARSQELTAREQEVLTHLEVAMEMQERGFGFLPVDLYASAADRFVTEAGGLRMPFLSLPGLGNQVANRIVEARAAGPFLSVEDLRVRARLPRNLIELLSEFGCTRQLPDRNQITLF